ncbi:retention module-containing protein, partial [Aeromonas jandaei]|uniref:retention module-containing protein n=1 Tax=Aeromonas jandaei TaxID=650 RepID=UPI003BA216C2
MITNAITLEQGVTVTQLKGKIYLLAADGSRKLLVEGDVLPKGAVIVSPDGGSFMGGNQSFNVQPAGQPSESAEEGDAPQLAQNGAPGTPSDINALQQAILGGADPTKTFEASAAGGAPAAGGGGVGGVAGASGNGGFVTIDRVGDATISQAGFDTTNPVDTGVIANALPGTDNQLIDLVPPVITVSAPDNTNDTTPTLTGTTDAPAGSIVTLLVTDANGNQQTLIAIVNPNGTFTVDVVTPLAEGSYTVTASVTDPAGNTGTATDNGSVDVTAPTITVDAPDNTTDTTPTITGTTNAAPGSTVTLVVTDANGNQQTLTAIVQPGGGYSVDVTTPLAEGSYKVDASVTDPAGNTGSATDNGSVDTVAPELGIDLDPIVVGSDNTVNKAEADDKASVTLSGTVSGDAKVGDTVTLTLGDGSKLTTQVVVLGNGQLGFSTSTTADKLVDGTRVKAEITVTDAAGNSTTKVDSEGYMVDTTATGAPTVVITEDTNNDGTIDRTEISGKVNVEVSLPGDAKAGDTLKVSGQADRVLTADDITAGKVGYEFDRPADGVTLTVTATIVDAAGNVSLPGSDSATMGDTTATGAPTVVITEDTNNDGTIDRTEISGKVNVEVSLPGDAKAGDTLKVSGQADRVLTADDITAGKVGYEFDRPADGVTLTVTATIVDAAGNVSLPGSDSATMGDTTATGAPAVVITEDTNNDGTIDRIEISGKVNVEVSLPGDAKAGDTLKVSGQAERVLTADDITAGKVGYEFDRPADGVTLTVTATIVDAAGNVSLPGSDSAVMGDTTATGAPTVVITEDSNNDGTIDRTEISGKVNVEVGLPSEARAGDTLKVSGQADRVLTADDITAGKVGYEFDRPADGVTLTVTATIVDAAGSISPEGSDSAVMGDTTATGAPTVVITEDSNNDGTIDRTELSGKVNVEVGLPSEARAGDTLKVSGQADRVLTADDITAGKVGYEFDRPADGVTLTVTATIVDAAGSISPEGSDSAVMGDTTATGAPTVVITEDSNNDGTIDRTELSGKVDVEVGLPSEARAGDTLKVSGQADRVLIDADISAGKVGYEFDRPADGVTLTVTATIVDAAGSISP